jgi:hypothetical protein
MDPGANVRLLFTIIIYSLPMVLLSLRVIIYYWGNYHRISVITMVKSFVTLVHGGKLKYRGN